MFSPLRTPADRRTTTAARSTLTLALAVASFLFASAVVADVRADANAPVVTTVEVGCEEPQFAANTDCSFGHGTTATRTVAAAAEDETPPPDYTRYGCAGTTARAPWCDK